LADDFFESFKIVLLGFIPALEVALVHRQFKLVSGELEAAVWTLHVHVNAVELQVEPVIFLTFEKSLAIHTRTVFRAANQMFL
jgi:hypothetical protein